MTIRVALVKDNKVENLIVADSIELIKPLFPLDVLVEQTEETYLAWIGARWNGSRFESPKKFESWIWNEQTFDYDPPKPKPETGVHTWNEALSKWVEFLAPFDSWKYNTKTTNYEAPKPRPENDKNYSWEEKVGNWVVVN